MVLFIVTALFLLIAIGVVLTLAKGTPAEVAAECRSVLTKARARDGAFILGSGCALSRLTTAENLGALRDSVDDF